MTISGKGSVDEIHSLSLGVVGDLGGWEHAVEAVEKSDLIIVVGSKLPQYATYNWKLLENKNIIHIDIDPEELERNFPALLKLAGDAKETLRKLHYLLSGWKSEDEWVRFIYRLKEQQLKEFEKINSDQPRGEAIDPRIIMVLLNKITDEKDVLISDASSASGWTAKYYMLKRGGRAYIAPRGFAGLGYGLPASIGVYASGVINGRVIVVTGDGGFGYSISELETIKRTGYPIMIIILNDSALGWIKLEQEILQDGKVISSTFLNIDYARIAESFGINGYRVERIQELDKVLKEAYYIKEPIIIDVKAKTDPSFSYSLYKASKKRS
jgi:acetolactate synthase-1/2/3 large subunit